MKKTKKWILVGVACASFWQPMQAQRIQQPLGRGVVAVQNGDAITLTWRKLAQEPENVEYNVYCRASGGSYTKVNSSPLSQTNLQTTTSRVPVGSEVAGALVVNGVAGARHSGV